MVYIDAHVHLHDCFNLATFFNHVEKNVKSILQTTTQPEKITCCLFLTEASNANYFEKIRNRENRFFWGGPLSAEGWQLHPTSEPFSTLITNEAGFRIFIIAGQQLHTAEGMEVLAVAPNYRIAGGKSLEKMISEIIEADGLAVVPWGFGKWMGRRGKVLQGIVERSSPSRFFLGDNSGRPRFLPEPLLFQLASKKFIRILPGSDPLPFPSEVSRAGSFGLSFDGEISSKRPARELKQKLTSSGLEFDTFGQLETFGRFIRNQLLMQIVKRRTNSFK